MTTLEDIIKLRDCGEQTTVQFKERITASNKYDVGCEMVALSNTQGGTIIIGINDKTGEFNALSFDEVQETTMILSNLASENVIPAILITIENVPFDNGTIVVASIKQGLNKPYHDNKGIIWVKQGVDKRRVFDNTELATMMMENRHISPDAVPITGANFEALDANTVREYLIKRFRSVFDRQALTTAELWHKPLEELANIISNGQTSETLLKNLGLIMPDGTLTLAALMLMGTFPQRWLPVFTARCISFVGNNIGGTQFRDKSGSDADGNALHLYNYIMSFLTRNLRQIQVNKDFNSQGELEISGTALSELVVNAILHRSYLIEAPIRIFIFDNRVEIHSPGLLPEGVNTENIRQGISVPRNKLLFNHGIHLLPYTGAGSGITRAINGYPNMQFTNNSLTNEFVITIERKEIPEELIISSPNLNYIPNTTPDNIHNSTIDTIHNSIHDTIPDTIHDSTPNSIHDSTPNSIHDTIPDTIPDSTPDTIPDSTPDSQLAHKRLRKKDLNDKQKDIINFCSIPRTSKEILQRVGVSYHSTNVQKYITDLIDNGFLERTIPEQPFDKNQKYRRVKKKK